MVLTIFPPPCHKSVFGMQTFTISPTDWRFAVTMVAVCVPFFILIFVLQTHAGMSLYRRLGLYVASFREKLKRKAAVRRERRTQIQQIETIRRQSCATTIVAGKRESTWRFDSKEAGKLGTPVSDANGGTRAWWKWSRKVPEELGVSTKDMNV